MDDISYIYYINLSRRPDRNEHFLNQCEKAKIPLDKIKRFEAIDGSTYNFTEEEKSMFSKCDFLDKHYVNSIMGNQLSHYYILKEMIEKLKQL